MIDKTIFNLCGLFLTGIGIFSALTTSSPKELHSSFAGDNPFSIKNEIITDMTILFFSVIAILGIVMEGASITFPSMVSERNLYNQKFYTIFFFCTLFLVYPFARVITFLACLAAKRKWRPEVVQSQRELYESIEVFIVNNGLRKDQLKLAKNREETIETNRIEAEKGISQIEKLLEIKPSSMIIKDRFHKLQPYFKCKKIEESAAKT